MEHLSLCRAGKMSHYCKIYVPTLTCEPRTGGTDPGRSAQFNLEPDPRRKKPLAGPGCNCGGGGVSWVKEEEEEERRTDTEHACCRWHKLALNRGLYS